MGRNVRQMAPAVRAAAEGMTVSAPRLSARSGDKSTLGSGNGDMGIAHAAPSTYIGPAPAPGPCIYEDGKWEYLLPIDSDIPMLQTHFTLKFIASSILL